MEMMHDDSAEVTRLEAVDDVGAASDEMLKTNLPGVLPFGPLSPAFSRGLARVRAQLGLGAERLFDFGCVRGGGGTTAAAGGWGQAAWKSWSGGRPSSRL